MQANNARAEDEDALRARAFRALDAANADDPARIFVRGRERAKERAHAELACEWVAKLCDAPSLALWLAARAHHLRRWTQPRSAHPPGRRGYHAWRRAAQHFHADEAGRILRACGCAPEVVTRAQALIRKELRGDAEAQVFEDALCLVFLETQLEALAERFAPRAGADDDDAHAPSLPAILQRTLAKMSPRARELSDALPLGARGRAALTRALETFYAAKNATGGAR